MSKSDLAAPRTIGHYTLMEVVGEGGIGTVYRARDSHSGQIVAVKVMAAEMAANPVLLKRFEQEFSAAQLVKHPNVVRALAYDRAGGIPYLVMEFVEGETIGEMVERDGPLPEPEAIRLILQVCQGVHWIHRQGIIHRDIKPDNVIVTPLGEARLTDLGLVKDRWGEGDLTNTGRGLGTPHYMAPEQFRNAKHADIRADVYGIGATLYTMVTGKIPFDTCGSLDALLRKTHNEVPSPRSLVPSLSERTEWVIRRAMSGDISQRPQSCKDFARDLIGDQTVVKSRVANRETLPEVAGTAPAGSLPFSRPVGPTPGEVVVPEPSPALSLSDEAFRAPRDSWQLREVIGLSLTLGTIAALTAALLVLLWK